MKRIALFLLAVLAIHLPAFSTIHTVCNMPYSPGQYTTYQSAEAAAADGDTIYVHGSSFSYGNIGVFRSLVIVGAGFYPNKQLPMTSMFGDINIQHDNVQLIGLTVNTVGSGFVNNVAVKKCRLIGNGAGGYCVQARGTSWLIEGNIFDAPALNYAIEMGFTGPHTIQHNIFATGGNGIQSLLGSIGTPCYVLNNVFLGDGGPAWTALSNVNHVVVRNNIFYGIPAYSQFNIPGGLNIIERNLTYASINDNYYPLGLYPDNAQGLDPVFTAYGGSNTPYNTDNNFVLNPLSPVHNYGTDGTDIGVFGGIGEHFTVTGEPSIAEITVFDITSPTTVAPGGTLTISVTSKRVK